MTSKYGNLSHGTFHESRFGGAAGVPRRDLDIDRLAPE